MFIYYLYTYVRTNIKPWTLQCSPQSRGTHNTFESRELIESVLALCSQQGRGTYNQFDQRVQRAQWVRIGTINNDTSLPGWMVNKQKNNLVAYDGQQSFNFSSMRTCYQYRDCWHGLWRRIEAKPWQIELNLCGTKNVGLALNFFLIFFVNF